MHGEDCTRVCGQRCARSVILATEDPLGTMCFMKFLRAAIIGVTVYVATFCIGGAVAMLLQIEMTPDAAIPPVMWYVSSVSAIALMIFGSLWFFRWKKIGASAGNGLLLGCMSIVVGFALDSLILLGAGASEDLVESLLSYYMEPIFLFTLALIVLVPVSTGALLGRKK